MPVDAVTGSGSGLDPDISPAYAALQVPRIARNSGRTPAQRVVTGLTHPRHERRVEAKSRPGAQRMADPRRVAQQVIAEIMSATEWFERRGHGDR